MRSIIYLIVGTFFGIVLYKSEAASWFRIYEMFQLDSHMYGIIGSAGFRRVVYPMVKRSAKSVDGEPITIADKDK